MLKTLLLALVATLLTNTHIAAENARMLTLGYPPNVEIEYGRVTFGAEPPEIREGVEGLGFAVVGTVPDGEAGDTIVYGLSRTEDHVPQVWRARTRDGMVFTDAAMLFQVPAIDNRWLAGALAEHDGRLLLLQSELGRPPTKGHPFHLFGGNLDGGNWRQLNDDALYRGQDSLSMIWNDELNRLVNYQVSYQSWKKRFPDNMPKIRRVLHIRTSPDGLEWTPGGSFGADGPYLPEDQLILPGENDSEDTEFYHFAAVDLGEFWAGIVEKYVSQPPNLPKAGRAPHGPHLGYAWWVSKDGLNWLRPFGENSGLDGVARGFVRSPSGHIRVGNELRRPVRDELYVLDRTRLFYAYSRANGQLVTEPVTLAGRPITLEVSFESARCDSPSKIYQGYVMAELVGADGQVLPNFEREQCVFLPEAGERLTLKWGGCALPKQRDRPVRLRLLFRHVRLYSMHW